MNTVVLSADGIASVVTVNTTSQLLITYGRRNIWLYHCWDLSALLVNLLLQLLTFYTITYKTFK